MKIIIFFILFTVQAQYDELDPPVTDGSNLNTQNDQRMFSSGIPDAISSDGLYTSDLGLTTSSDDENLILKDQWYSVNQSTRRDPSRSALSWKRTALSRRGANYILTSEPRCTRQMCSVRLKYNGTLSPKGSGCLSFSLRTRGQPDGQLWIVEDQELENSSQKIQLISNKTLQVEHSLRSRIRNISIETKIMFRNLQTDAVLLSNLNLNWKGPCPKKRRRPTPSPHWIDRRATFDDSTMMTLATNEDQEYFDDLTTTATRRSQKTTKRPFHFMNQKNIGWFLTLIILFCFLTVLSAGAYNLWLIRPFHTFTLPVALNTQIRLLARRSLRSSTRSDNKIATISQMVDEVQHTDLQTEQIDTSIPNDNDRLTPMSYYTYL